MTLFPSGAAIISADNLYRYRLDRDLRGDGPPMVVCMVNPSTADASKDDPTIRRLVGFGRRENASSLVVVNVFAYRSPYVESLRGVADPVGPENEGTLRLVAAHTGRVVCAWGARAKVHRDLAWRIDATMTILRQHADLYALRLTKGGDPEHPLMLPNSCKPTLWRARLA